MSKAEQIIEKAAEDCEGANYHNLCRLPQELFDKIKKLVPPDKHNALAKAIASGVTSVL